MEKKKLHFLVLILILIIFGCNKQSSTGIINYDFKQGTNGLELNILPNMPPKEILEGGDFKIAIKIDNKGAYDIGPGYIYITGLNEIWLPLEEDEIKLPALKGRSLDAPEGEFFIAEFTGKNKKLPVGLETYAAPFYATVVYDYSTTAETDVCINSELLSDLKSESCKVKDRISFGGQGAPMAITNIEEVIIPSKDTVSIEFTFTMENKGDGEVTSDIQIDDVKLGTRRINCNKREISREDLEQGKSKFTCYLKEPQSTPYTTKLSAALYYTYKSEAKGSFTIRSGK